MVDATPCGEPWTSGAIAGVDETTAARVHRYVTEVLWALSGRRFAVCSDVVDLCVNRCLADRCRCWPERCSLDLPQRPVIAVSEVVDDGETLLAESYDVVDAARLVLVDPLARCWSGPVVTVSYTWGEAPPPGGLLAADEFVAEVAKAVAGDSSCRLPRRVQSITRQGVTMAFLDPGDYLAEGRVGLPLVDQWLTAMNPDKLSSPSLIASPDYPADRRRWPVVPPGP